MTLNDSDDHNPIDALPGTIVLRKTHPDEVSPRTWLIIGQSTYVHATVKYMSGLLTMGQSTKFIEKIMLVSRADVKAGNVVLFEPEERGR